MPTLLISRIARELSKRVDKDLRAVGITASQLPVLVALKGGRKLTQKELTEVSGVEQSSMAQLLARMERDGFIRREPSQNDRRSSVISLTDLALERLDPGRHILRRIDDDVCAIFSEDDRKILTELLGRLRSKLENDTPPLA
jgi:DNA-binding MarR family transcriptional regulator